MILRLLAKTYLLRYRLERLRRIFAVKPHERVLDIGSGASPFAPADVICEKYPWDDRERPFHFVADRPLVVGDLEALPFKDQSFDFIYLSHVLEHAYDPAKVIAELTRVGNRGYIEVPSAYFEKAVRSIPGHYWFIDEDKGVLVFRAKPRGIVDPEINDTAEREVWDRDPLFMAFYHARLFNLFHIARWWKGSIPYRIEGNLPDRAAFEKGSIGLGHGLQKPEDTRGLAHGLKQWVRRRAKAAKTMRLEDIVACPFCHGALTTDQKSWTCSPCQKAFPIVNGHPILLCESATPSPSLNVSPTPRA